MSGPEATLQKQVVEYLRTALRPYRGTVFAIQNNREAKKTAGFQKGAPDVAFCVRGQLYGIELKSKSGVASDDQKAVHAAWRDAGAMVFVARSLETVEGIVAALRAGRVRDDVVARETVGAG